LDWKRAEPILKKHLQGKRSRVAALALTLLYRHAVSAGDKIQADSFRNDLKSMVLDTRARGYARYNAFKALFETDWPGREQWYISLFKHISLLHISDGYYGLCPLKIPLRQDPDHWIPLVASLVGHADKNIHNNAVGCLADLKGRRDAVKPLIPWLTDPDWAKAIANDRSSVIYNVGKTRLPGCVLDLIWILENDQNKYYRADAAGALAEYRDKRAVPALQKALSKLTDFQNDENYYKALIACGGLSVEEIVHAIEAWAVWVILPNKQLFKPDKGPNRYVKYIGEYMIRRNVTLSPETLQALMKRIRKHRIENPKLANKLQYFSYKWRGKAIDQYIMERIISMDTDATTIKAALKRRKDLRERYKKDLVKLYKNGNAGSGIAAVLLGDKKLIQGIFQTNDVEAQRATLACARLIREPISLKVTAKLLKQENRQLAKSAELYLTALDSPGARSLLLDNSPGKIKIVGLRSNFDAGHNTFPQFEKWENILIDKISKTDGPHEIISLLSEGYWGSAGQRIIAINDKGARLCIYRDPAYYQFRLLKSEEIKKLKEFIAKNKIANLPPLDTSVADGRQYEFVHITRKGGVRVYMNNPGVDQYSGGSLYEQLIHYFFDLNAAGSLKTYYKLGNRREDLEVLLADEKEDVMAVWKSGNDLRMLIANNENKTGNWWSLKKDGKREKSVTPFDYRIINQEEYFRWNQILNLQDNYFPWRVKTGNSFFYAGFYGNVFGLWKCSKGKKPEIVAKGIFSYPLVSLDGKWLVAIKKSRKKIELIRLDLSSTRKMVTILHSANGFVPVTCLPDRGKFLLKNQNSDFFLIDVTSGEIEKVEGEMEPWEQITYRPLQPTGKPHHVWAALCNYAEKYTDIGYYNTKRFYFKPHMRLPDICFDSMQMWIDEPEKKVYVTYNGHLLRLSLEK
jgi:HEAT repeat protein